MHLAETKNHCAVYKYSGSGSRWTTYRASASLRADSNNNATFMVAKPGERPIVKAIGKEATGLVTGAFGNESYLQVAVGDWAMHDVVEWLVDTKLGEFGATF